MIVDLDTQFNHYQIADTYYNGRPARVLYSGHNEAAQSGVAQDDGPDLLFDYNQRFRELVRGVRPRRMLILGGGAFTLPTALLQEFPRLWLDIVELDGALVDVAREYFGFQPSAYTNVYVGDGCRFLNQTTQHYGAIVMDVFNHDVIPSEFQTLEVAQSMRRCLAARGVVAVNIIASRHGSHSAPLKRIHTVMRETFPDVRIFPAGPSVSPWIPQNYILTAHDGSQNLAPFLRYPAVEAGVA